MITKYMFYKFPKIKLLFPIILIFLILSGCFETHPVQKLIADLEHENYSVRKKAFSELMDVREPEAIPFLLEAFQSERKEIRKAMLFVFERLDDPRVTKALFKALRDKNIIIRQNAVKILGSRKNVNATDDFGRILLEDESWIVRNAAMNILLSNLSDEKARRYLLNALNDKNEEIRKSVVRGMSWKKPLPFLEDIFLVYKNGDSVIEKLSALQILASNNDNRVIEPLLEFYSVSRGHSTYVSEQGNKVTVSDYTPLDQVFLRERLLEIVTSLGRFKDTRITSLMLEILEEKDVAIKMVALRSLRAANLPELILPLIGFTRDENKLLKVTAVRSLSAYQGEHLIPHFKKIIKHEDPYFRFEAMKALARIGGKDVYPVLESFLLHDDQEIRYNTIVALGNMLEHNYSLLLIKSLKDKDWYNRREAATLLGRLNSEAAVPALIEALKDEEAQVRKDAVKALNEIGDRRAIPHLKKLIHDENEYVRKYVLLGLEGFGEKLDDMVSDKFSKSREPKVRAAYVQSLAKLPKAEAIPKFIEALKDNSDLVRQEAIKFLGRIVDRRVLPALLPLLEDNNANVRIEVVKTLSGIDDPRIVPALLTLLKDKRSFVRFYAIQAVGDLKAKEAIKELIKALGERDPWVGLEVCRSLHKIGGKEVIEALLEALEDSNEQTRRHAVITLWWMKDKSTIKKLLLRLKDEVPHVRGIAIRALASFNAPSLKPYIVAMMLDRDQGVRVSAASVLVADGDKRALAILIDAYRNGNRFMRDGLRKTLSKIDNPAVKKLLQEKPGRGWRRLN